MAMIRTKCRRCRAEIVADDTKPLPDGFPFCSARCKLLDLGKWFNEDYKVSRKVEERDLDEGD